MENKSIKTHKKGSITTWIIIGVLIVLSFLVIVYYQSNNNHIDNIEKIDSKPIKLYVETCLSKTIKEGIDFNSLQGGYYEVNGPKEEYGIIQIPVYFENNITNVPKKEILETELMKYIKENLDKCLNNLDIFKKEGVSTEISKDITGYVKLKGNIAWAEIIMPITITKSKTQKSISQYSAIINTRYLDANLYAKNITDKQQEDKEYVPIGYIIDLAKNNNFTFEQIYLSDNSFIFAIVVSENNNNKLVYSFINKYAWETNNTPPIFQIYPIPEINITSEGEFNYTIKSSEEGIKYSDTSDLFDIIEETGLISFNVSTDMNGEYYETVFGEDMGGNREFQTIKLNINITT